MWPYLFSLSVRPKLDTDTGAELVRKLLSHCPLCPPPLPSLPLPKAAPTPTHDCPLPSLCLAPLRHTHLRLVIVTPPYSLVLRCPICRPKICVPRHQNRLCIKIVNLQKWQNFPSRKCARARRSSQRVKAEAGQASGRPAASPRP